MEKVLCDFSSEWILTVVPESEVVKSGFDPKTPADISGGPFKSIPGSVPGNFELDLLAAGLIDDPFFGSNVFKMQELEDRHLWYSTVFDCPGAPDGELFLRFEGIDTVSDIYLNGVLLGHTENMLIAHEFGVSGLKAAGNTLVVHIYPSVIWARKYELTPRSRALLYSYSALQLRKAPYMYGWDIMPRIVSGGIWRPVKLVEKPRERLEICYLYTTGVYPYAGDNSGAGENPGAGEADLNLFYAINLHTGTPARGTYIEVEGKHGSSVFKMRQECWHTYGNINGRFGGLKLWYPKNYGEPALYDVTVRLTRGSETLDSAEFKTGIRTVALERTSVSESDENPGKFQFTVNGTRIFALGTNWVPLDAFPSRNPLNLPRALSMLDDIGCNMVRCWGGNVYEDDAFYDFCDERGILVWQDFAMACAIYPDDSRMKAQLGHEAETVIKRLRNHPSLALWAGDNECDVTGRYLCGNYNPNDNVLTREVLADAVRRQDITRQYLPSSPYIDEEAYASGKPTSEDHLWGPRDYFKGDYYRSTVCCFASETGYHGCPSPDSLRKFLSPDNIWPHNEPDGTTKPEWLAHCTTMEPKMDSLFSYRINLMTAQVKTMFGHVPDALEEYAKMSQISQAEAFKYFIERFRISKWRRSGIIWWNLIDGWPQISDAVVDYYGDKKLAYHYIKRSQAPVCMAFDEPIEGALTLYLINDTGAGVTVFFTVTDLVSGRECASGTARAEAHTSAPAISIPTEDAERFLHIKWKSGGESGDNHYATATKNACYETYLAAMEKAGYEVFDW